MQSKSGKAPRNKAAAHTSYQLLLKKLREAGYGKIQYRPTRKSLCVGQELRVFLSILFQKKSCLFNSTAFYVAIQTLLDFLHPKRSKLFRIFFQGKAVRHTDLVPELFTAKEFDVFEKAKLFKKANDSYHSTYRIVPFENQFVLTSFPSRTEKYIHLGFDTITALDLIRRELRKYPMRGRALEIGCGTGFLSLAVAKRFAAIDAVDIDPEAVRMTKINTILNSAKNVKVLESNIYSRVKGSYDYIFSNPPFEFLPIKEKNKTFAYGGKSGIEVTNKILLGLKKRLKSKGSAHILTNTYITHTNKDLLLESIKKNFKNSKMVFCIQEISYQTAPNLNSFYKKNKIKYSKCYFLTIKWGPYFNVKIRRLNIYKTLKEKIRLLFLQKTKS